MKINNYEDYTNIIPMFVKVTEQRRTDWQMSHSINDLKIGKCYKKAFEAVDKSGHEHMWVELISISENSKVLVGILQNIPVHSQIKEKLHDVVTFEFTEIEASN